MRASLLLVGLVAIWIQTEATHCPPNPRDSLTGRLRTPKPPNESCELCELLFDPNSSFMQNCGQLLTPFLRNKLETVCPDDDQFEDFILNLNILCEYRGFGTFEEPDNEDCGCDFCELLFDPNSDFMRKCAFDFSADIISLLRQKCDKTDCGTYSIIYLENWLASYCQSHGRPFTFPSCECDECVMLFAADSDFMMNCGMTFGNTTLDELFQTCALCMDNVDALFTFFQTLNTMCEWKGFDAFDLPVCDCTDFCWHLMDEDRDFFKDCFSQFAFSERLQLFKACRSVHQDVVKREQFVTDLEAACLAKASMTVKVPRDCVNCVDRQFDLVLVVDNSGSISPAEMDDQKNFLQAVAASFTIDNSQTRLGLVKFANNVQTAQTLGSDNDPVSVSAGIAAIEACASGSCPLGSSRTDTAAGLNAMTSMFNGFPSSNQRFGLVVTDGRSNQGNLNTAVSGIPPDVIMYAVGVNNAVQSELELIAGDSDRVKTVGDFNQLSGIINALREQICQ